MKADAVMALLRELAHGNRGAIELRALQVACQMPASQLETAKAYVAKMKGTVEALPHDVATLVEAIEPSALDRLVLPDAARKAASAAGEEVRGRERLASFGLRPRTRLLFTGPPGTGKTSLAGAIGTLAGLPAYRVRLASIASSYLGETGGRVVRLFEALRRHAAVWVFDEIESIGARRGEKSDVGEATRSTNALLSAFDGGTGESVVVATTNRPDLVDPALLRRFDCRVELGAPGPEALASQAHKLNYRFGCAGMAVHGDGLAWAGAAGAWAAREANHAHVAHAFEAVARDVALGRAQAISPEAVTAEIWPLLGEAQVTE
jgi:SpoVK/Ycf46/Vps4 family AAA+-type ATPase